MKKITLSLINSTDPKACSFYFQQSLKLFPVSSYRFRSDLVISTTLPHLPQESNSLSTGFSYMQHCSSPIHSYLFYFWPRRLWDLSSPARDWTLALTVTARSPNHRTAGEFPPIHSLDSSRDSSSVLNTFQTLVLTSTHSCFLLPLPFHAPLWTLCTHCL